MPEKHTPAPWLVHDKSTLHMQDVRVATLGTEGRSSERHIVSHEPGIANPNADAHLIAAAPDLLAACVALLERLAVKERQLAGHRIGHMPQTVFDKLDKTAHAEAAAVNAINKARGAA